MEKEKLIFFCDKIAFPHEFREAVFPVIEKINTHYQDEYRSINSSRLEIEGYNDLSEKMNERLDLVMLALCIMMGMDSKERYDLMGIDDEVYYASQREITIWSKKNHADYGRIGIFGHVWLNNFFDPHVFRLGRLDFEQYSFWNGTGYSVGGIDIRPGDKCINVHIPEDGKLDHHDVLESYKKAYDFFGLTGYYPFICHSWLLFPGNREFLPEESNIIRFMNDYNIVTHEEYDESPDFWRIYGFHESYDLEKLPKNTSLQRRLAEHLTVRNGTFGRGGGVFFYNGTDFIR